MKRHVPIRDREKVKKSPAPQLSHYDAGSGPDHPTRSVTRVNVRPEPTVSLPSDSQSFFTSSTQAPPQPRNGHSIRRRTSIGIAAQWPFDHGGGADLQEWSVRTSDSQESDTDTDCKAHPRRTASSPSIRAFSHAPCAVRTHSARRHHLCRPLPSVESGAPPRCPSGLSPLPGAQHEHRPLRPRRCDAVHSLRGPAIRRCDPRPSGPVPPMLRRGP